MQVQTFVADNMPEAILQIRKHMGKDAVILNSRKVYQRRWWSLKKTVKYEVSACLAAEAPEVQSQLTSNSRPTDRDEIQTELKQIRSMLQTAIQTNDAMIVMLSDYLREQGLTRELAMALIQEISHDTNAREEVKQSLQRRLVEQLHDFQHTAPIRPESRVIAFVGPTGVGKTTTIAKLADAYVANGKKVGLITTDTYRIAAIEQLKTYAKILEIPVEVAYKPEELTKAMERLRHCDVILVDTSGRNFRLMSYVEETKAFLRELPVDETLLVLSLTMKPKDINYIVEMFMDLPADKFVFTKLDETDTYGSILNVLLTHKKPMSYITMGQSVPTDIEIPSVDRIVNMVLEGIQ